MITKEQYDNARKVIGESEKIIQEYNIQQIVLADERYKEHTLGNHYKDEELFYSRTNLCPCGHGLAYPNQMGSHRYWDCSAILKGVHDTNVTHTGELSFAFHDVKGEQEYNGVMQTARGVFKPQVKV